MNLIEMIKNEMGSDVISSLSQKAGVTEDQVKTGISAGVPAVFAGILKNGASGDFGFLGKLFSGVNNTAGGSKPADILNGDHADLLEKGKSMLSGLFGKDSDAVTGAVSSSSGLSTAKSVGLLAMIVPLITGYISKLMATKGWSVSDLIGKIFERKDDITAALPQGLSDSLGVNNIKMPDLNMPKVDLPKVDVPKVPHVNYGVVKEPKTGGVFKWLIPLLIILAAGWWLMGRTGCNSPKVENTMGDLTSKVDSMGSTMDSATNAMKAEVDSARSAITGKLNEAGDYVRDLGAMMTKKLPDGTEIKVAENSVESRLLSFIEDKNKPVDKTTWFTFDRLYFETGKSVLKPESQEQLKNIDAILKAYPNVKLKIGGYTDNTGDAAVNKKISDERANVAMHELVKMGIDAKRLSAEGYGPEHPVASNDTPEGRAQNRRIDIRVTEK
ncbi:MAG: OmpA family protein [Candidatus Pedobacter colombiensis]|uniref:OmpA family protein n=1 Tax=Candidatus Pedobacter colombiensis TaxID=3121371 RepID=A0AAJ5W6I3_9SPHI|nr:OmpA family protein [Pedobacter sp.]WEK18922.1 MAG: OmpA family protein [Pedobacter sp.]